MPAPWTYGRHSYNQEGFHPVFARNPAKKFPDALFDGMRNPRHAMFGAENEMVLQGGVGVGDGRMISERRRPFNFRSARVAGGDVLPGLESPGYHRAIAPRYVVIVEARYLNFLVRYLDFAS